MQILEEIPTGIEYSREEMRKFCTDDIVEKTNGFFQDLKHPADIIAGNPVYDTFEKKNVLYPWKYIGQCKQGERRNLSANVADYIFICSRLSSDTKEEMKLNLAVAKWASYMAYQQGLLAIAPHLLFPQFLDDSIIEQREFGMQAGIRFVEQLDIKKIWFITVDNEISTGMKREIDYMIGNRKMEEYHTNLTKEMALNLTRRFR